MVTALSPSASILLFGQDQRLVETRQWVIEMSDFRVLTAFSLTELLRKASEEPVQLFVLCDSLAAEMRAHALELIHSRWPGAKRLILAPCGVFVEIEPSEEVFAAPEGPAKLMTTIRTLILNGAVAAV